MAITAEASKAKYPSDDGAEVMLVAGADGAMTFREWMTADEADALAEQLKRAAAEWRARRG